MGVRLVSFGVHWIKAEIHEYVIKNWRIVKVATTKAQRKLFFKLRSAKKRLGWFTAEEVQAVAMDLGVTPKEVVEMEKRLNARDDSLDYFPEDDEGYAHPAHYLEAPESLEPQSSMMNDQEAIQNQQLHYALKTLDERSQDIIKHRWLNEPKAPLKDLAEKHGISIERTRQVEAMALAKLRALLPAEEV
jgi:RNA polymerase sigma-32 factor